MSVFTMVITADSVAFTDDGQGGQNELRRILYKVSGQVTDGLRDGAILDVNGNTVGHWEWPDAA